jgi:DNA processing protein
VEKFLLALNTHPKIGSQTIKKLLYHFGESEKIWKMPTSQISLKIDEKIVGYINEVRDKINPDYVVEQLQRLNIGYLTFRDSDYPSLLKEASDCPAILYIKGSVKALTSNPIGVVGSRKYSNYGQRCAYKFSFDLAKSGLSIISGLALGIDAFAHRAAIDANGLTVGVLGCGLDKIYPVSNYNLAKEILESGGAIISEYPLGTTPAKYNFPARNRIVAGLSLGTLVVEAAEKSGALITAYEALDYNREVFAIPANIDSLNSVGSNKLIQAGAKLVMSPADIINELNLPAKNNFEKARESIEQSDEESVLVNNLKDGPMLINEIVLKSGLNINQINSALTLMEIKGEVINLGGGRFQLL